MGWLSPPNLKGWSDIRIENLKPLLASGVCQRTAWDPLASAMCAQLGPPTSYPCLREIR